MSHPYVWQQGDTLLLVCGRFLRAAGYGNTYTFMSVVQRGNPDIRDWDGVPAGTVITLLYQAS